MAGVRGRQEEVITKVLDKLGGVVKERGRREEARKKRGSERRNNRQFLSQNS